MKLFWTGTDSLMLVDYSMRRPSRRIYWWIFRRLIRIMDFFVESHYCDAENVADNVRKFGVRKNIVVVPDRINETVYRKEKHDVFTILYYYPDSKDGEFRDWLYGKDVFDEVRLLLPEYKYLIVRGQSDMRYVYPWVDFYLRPNRHDGASRMRRECEINNIPYYWTQKDPSVEGAIEAINEAEKNSKIQGVL